MGVFDPIGNLADDGGEVDDGRVMPAGHAHVVFFAQSRGARPW